MQAEAIVLEKRSTEIKELGINENLFIKPIGLLARIFGCKHQQLSRPFKNENESYRVCLHCGAQRKFDTDTFKTYGPFYFKTAPHK